MTMAMAMSLGPTSLYADKPSPKTTPFFGTSKKMRSVRTIRMAVVSRRDLSFSTPSRRRPFTKKLTFQGCQATAAAGCIHPPRGKDELLPRFIMVTSMNTF